VIETIVGRTDKTQVGRVAVVTNGANSFKVGGIIISRGTIVAVSGSRIIDEPAEQR
jgi:hypothetical protein